MSNIVTNRQSEIQLSHEALEVGKEVYQLSDVLYADVADTYGYKISGFFRAEDRKLMFTAGMIILLIGVMIIFSIFWSQIRGFVGFLTFPLLVMIRSFIRQTKQASIERSEAPVTLRVHTRTASVEAYHTEDLFYARWLAFRINRAVKRNMLN